VGDHPVLPDYAGACITNVMPALLERPDAPPAWLPAAALRDQVVLLVIDGLGWEQLEARRSLTPTLDGLVGGPITTVAPSTTAAALTSITTGMPPGEHGLVGYRMAVHGEVLNVLRWSTASGDARPALPPHKIQPQPAFLGHRPPIVTRAEFESSAFSGAHLDGTRFNGYRTTSTLVTEVRRITRAGEPFVYAYYEGLDKVSHEYGLGEHYEAELVAVDRLVADLLAAVPPGVAVVVVSDHGQVEVGEQVVSLPSDVLAHVSMQSGEGRFRWLHARPGRATALVEAATDHLGDRAWVVTRDEVLLNGWFGPHVTEDARSRLGDVALVARDDVAFDDPHDTGPYHLVGRHGSMTSAEVYVPLLVGVAG
jgi:predicted AlkP superfamily pyrophosphatase or phosphodiesterase